MPNHLHTGGCDWAIQHVDEGLLRRVDADGHTLPRRASASSLAAIPPQQHGREFLFERERERERSPTGGKGKGGCRAQTDDAKWARWQAAPHKLAALSSEFITRRYKDDPDGTLPALISAAKEHMRVGTGASNAHDSDSQGEMSVVVERSVVSLVDPLSRARIGIPVRGKACRHVACFDLQTHLAFSCEAKPKNGNKKAPPWTCPVCHGSARWNELEVDELQVDALSSVPITTREIFVLGREWSEHPFDSQACRKGGEASKTGGEQRSGEAGKKAAAADVIELGSDDEEEKESDVPCIVDGSPEAIVIDPELDDKAGETSREQRGGGHEVIDLVSSDDDDAGASDLETHHATTRTRPVVLSDDDDDDDDDENSDAPLSGGGSSKRQRTQERDECDDDSDDPAWLYELD